MASIVLTYIVGFSLLLALAAPFFTFATVRLPKYSRGQTVILSILSVYLIQHIGWMSMQAAGILTYGAWMGVTVGASAASALGFAAFSNIRGAQYKNAFSGLWHDIRAVIARAPLLSALLGALLTFIFIRMIALPEAMADALTYHIMKAVIPLTLPGWPMPELQQYLLTDAVRAYPGFANMLSAWWMGLPFGGMDVNEGGNFATYLLGFIALYTLSRRIGGSVTGGLLTGLTYLITPLAIHLGTSGYVDLTAAAMPLCALCFVGQRGTDKERFIAALMIGIGIGLGVAARYSMLSTAALVGVGALGAFIYQSWGRLRLDTLMIVAQIVIIGIVAMLCGLPQYVHNWLVSDNPLYPHELTVGPLHFSGYYPAWLNASGAYTAFIEKPFLAKPEWMQLWLNWMDTANITWKIYLWHGYTHPTWGNALSWLVLPAAVSVVLFSRHRLFMMALMVLSFGFLISIPYAMPAYRFHLWAGLVLYPAVALLWDMARTHKAAAIAMLSYMMVFFVIPQSIMIAPNNLGDHMQNLIRDPSQGDWRAVYAEDRVQLATHDRPPGWSIDVGPEGVLYNAFYVYRRTDPFAETVWWEMRAPLDQSVARQGQDEPGLLILCANKSWCPQLAADPHYVMLTSGEDRSLYATRTSFNKAVSP